MKKYWREVVMAILLILLAISIYLSVKVRQELSLAQSVAQTNLEVMKELVEQNAKNTLESQAAVDSLKTIIEQSKVLIITKETKYETVKKSPVRTNFTDAELNKWIETARTELDSIKKHRR